MILKLPLQIRSLGYLDLRKKTYFLNLSVYLFLTDRNRYRLIFYGFKRVTRKKPPRLKGFFTPRLNRGFFTPPFYRGFTPGVFYPRFYPPPRFLPRFSRGVFKPGG